MSDNENNLFLNRIDEEEASDLLPSTVAVVVGRIPKKDASHTLALINTLWPMEESLRHLKRIRRVINEHSIRVDEAADDDYGLEVILGTGEPSDYEESPETTKDLPLTLLRTVQVPLNPPPNKAAFVRWNSVWPVTYHQGMDAKMRVAEETHILEILQRHQGLGEISCTILDYQSGEIIYDGGPLGSWQSCTDYIRQHQIGLSSHNQQHHHPLGHPVIRGIEAVAEVHRRAREERPSSASDGDYLCKGKIFLLRYEPCLFCAMALVHSRVQAVVFQSADPEFGALGSRTSLHRVQRLNHHYSVFQMTRKLQLTS